MFRLSIHAAIVAAAIGAIAIMTTPALANTARPAATGIVSEFQAQQPALQLGSQTSPQHILERQIAPCKSTTPGVYYGTFWLYNSPFWYEETGLWYNRLTNAGWQRFPCNVTVEQQCNPVSWVNCPPRHWWWQELVAYNTAECKACVLVTKPTGNQIGVVQYTTGSVKEIADLALPQNVYATSVAAAKNGAVYAQGVDDDDGGSPIYYFSPGSTTPSGELNASNMAGGQPGALAVDSKQNVYLSFNTANGSTSSLVIDEFLKGTQKVNTYATIGGATGTTTAVSRKDELLVGTVNGGSGSGGLIYVLAKGQIVETIPTAMNPDSISLDTSNKHLFVVDSENDVLATYAFPSGKSLSSGPLTEGSSGGPVVPTSMIPDNNAKE